MTKICERCGAKPEGGLLALHDYCAKCGKDLCPECMAQGCCGNVPAASGGEDDDQFQEDMVRRTLERMSKVMKREGKP